jgi:hypothetical protein
VLFAGMAEVGGEDLVRVRHIWAARVRREAYSPNDAPVECLQLCVSAHDASQAFLNARRPKDKPLFASYPEGFKNPGHCVLVQRMLYGLHDASYGWYECCYEHLVHGQSFVQSKSDECLFVKWHSEEEREYWCEGGELLPSDSRMESCAMKGARKPRMVLVNLHVDDFLSTGDDIMVQEYRSKLRQRFTMTGGKATLHYGLEVTRSEDLSTLSFGARGYIERLATKLGLTKGKRSSGAHTDGPICRFGAAGRRRCKLPIATVQPSRLSFAST